MAEAYIVAAARTAGGRKGGRLSRLASRPTSPATVLDALVDRSGVDPAAVEDVIMGCVDAGRRAVQQYRAQRGDGLEAAGKRARHLDRPAMRLVAAGAAFRRAGGDVGRHGRRDRRRRREHDARADGAVLGAAGQERLRPLQEPAHGGALPRHPVQPVHRRRNDGGEIRPGKGRARPVSPSRAISAPSRRPRPAPSRTRSCRVESPARTAAERCTRSTRASASTPRSRASAASS